MEIKQNITFTLRVPEIHHRQAIALAESYEVSVAEFYRKALENEILKQSRMDIREEVIDEMLPLVRRSVKEGMATFETRLGNLSAKTALQAGMARYSNEYVLEKAGYDMREIRTEARKRAAATLKKDIDSLAREDID